jgi:methylated-DNA-[protein]-cysteine S-methyltransferase
MILTFATIRTPIGPFGIVARGETVVASGWTRDVDLLLANVHPSLRPLDGDVTGKRDLGPLTRAAVAYHEGDLGAIDDIVVQQRSGPFLEHAWDVLRTVPAGAPVTYAELAAKSGRPDAVRAAASACARNAVALFVPCHRVVRTGGGLGGFRWGLEAKAWLLDHEASQPSPLIAPAPGAARQA